MNIICAAEKPSIAGLLSDHLHEPVAEQDIAVLDNPDETGSFLVCWQHEQFLLSPAGHILSLARRGH